VITRDAFKSQRFCRELEEGESEFSVEIVSCGAKRAPRKRTDSMSFLLTGAVCSDTNLASQKCKMLAHLWYISRASKWSVSRSRFVEKVESNSTLSLSRLWEGDKEAYSSGPLRKMTSLLASQKSTSRQRALNSHRCCRLGVMGHT
jgi:hypothetical protein